MTADLLKAKIRHVPDFPKPGILFYDITTLLRDPEGLRLALDAMAAPFTEAADRSRRRHGEPRLHLRRGPGRSARRPASCRSASRASCRRGACAVSYELEYGTDSLEIHADAIEAGQRVLIVDDLLATGGTARATIDLVSGFGAEIVACAFLVELTFLKGRARLGTTPVHAVLPYDD